VLVLQAATLAFAGAIGIAIAISAGQPPTPERLGLWLAGAMAAAAPVGWVFARRLARRQARPDAAGAGGDAVQAQAPDPAMMVGAVAHDLRAPLSRIRFRLERNAVGGRAQMLADLEQMDRMIGGVLEFARAGRTSASRELVELRSVLECVTDAAAVGGDVRLKDGPPMLVRGDPLELSRLFANLVDNALKYGRAARLRAAVSGAAVLVEIQDDGPGIAPEDLDRVFTPFFRTVAAQGLDVRGVGLGLSVARSIARAHGGDVVLDQRPGAGLRAVVRLPLAQAAGSRPAEPGAAHYAAAS
jgi:signal transduction histidine kinase